MRRAYYAFGRQPGALWREATGAQQVVLGAVEYARGLGFSPHADYATCAGHLGEWDGKCDITFGRDGKPTFIQGPYDNPKRILKTLRKSVGEGNFETLQVFR
jgi:hypothetical protein